jgi:dynein heavy chain
MNQHTQMLFQELNRKSLMVEEAVEEVLQLVKKSAASFKASEENDEFDDLMNGKEYIFGCK